MVTVAGIGVLVAGTAVALETSLVRLGLTIGALGVAGGSVFGTALLRAVIARSLVRTGPYARVRVVGWCRPPDGCNYALFFRDESSHPGAVVRLPIRRGMKGSAVAWVAGPVRPSTFGSVGLFDESGLLATGRVVDSGIGLKRWQRRATEPGRTVSRPPKDWLPPGGQ